MSNHGKGQHGGVIRFLFDNSLFLIGGALLALVWANVDVHSYHSIVHYDVGQKVRTVLPFEDAKTDLGHAAGADAEHTPETGRGAAEVARTGVQGPADAKEHEESSSHGLTIHFIVNDILMALFFAIAGKEVWESLLPGGALSNPRKAATPLLATAGGVIGPALLYVVGAILVGQSGWFGQEGALGRGWAVPCATDIAFSYLVARIIFGNGHPAIAFLLLLAIADDAAGLIILAIAYPQAKIQVAWFLMTVLAMVLALWFRKKLRLQSFWWYLLIPGTLSWFSFHFAGIHAALGLVPIIPCLPHAHTDLGIFAREELHRRDTLNEFEHWWKWPVEVILGFFGFCNAGVVLGNIGIATILVLVGLLIGKPVGITLLTWIAEKVFKLQIPAGMSYRHIVTLGTVAGIGFTVALFMSEAAYPLGKFPDELRDAVKMGALASFFASILAIAVARILGVKPGVVSEEAT